MSEDEGILAILERPIDFSEVTKTSQLPEIGGIPVEEVEEEEEVEYKKPRDNKEKIYEDAFCNTLDDMGIQYERQKRVETGVIDIFIYGQPPSIIEVKKAPTPYLLMQAVVQLKFYAKCFKNPKLYVSTPESIDGKYRSAMQELKVSEARRVFIPNPGEPEGVSYDPLSHKVVVYFFD